MADANAIKAGEAYVEMTLDKSKLDAGLQSAEQGTEKATKAVDRRTKQMTSSLFRITGGIGALHIATAAVAGAFEAVTAQKSINKAMKVDDLQAVVAGHKKLYEAQTAWIRAIPILGGSLGKLADAFRDTTIEDFAARLAKADDKGASLNATLEKLTATQIELMRATGASEADVAARQQADKMMTAKKDVGEKWEKFQEADKAYKEAKKIYDETQPDETGFVKATGRDVDALAMVLSKATAQWIKADQDLKAATKTRDTQSKISKATEKGGGIVGAIAASELAGGTAAQFGVATLPGAKAGAPTSVEERALDAQERSAAALESIDLKTPAIVIGPPVMAPGGGSW